MRKFQVSARLSITTDINPDGYFDSPGAEGIEEFEDTTSGMYGDSFTSDGGSVEFIVEAEDADTARDKAEDFLREIRFEANDNLDWEVADFDIDEFDEIVPEMTQERAIELIRAYLDREVEAGRMDTETQTAFLFVLDLVTP